MITAARATFILNPLKRAPKNSLFRQTKSFNSITKKAVTTNAKNNATMLLAFSTGSVIAMSSLYHHQSVQNSNKICCDSRAPLSGDIVMLEPTKEPSTGILFPRLCNALTFVGCGVRVKWRFVKVKKI